MTAVDPFPPSTASAGSSSGISTEPRRTTKETHPNLPPGLILDANGKVCKVCNSWQDWGKIRVKKKDIGDGPESSASSGSSSGNGGGKKVAAGMGAFAGFMTGAGSGSKPFSSSSISATTTANETATREPDRKDCPPDTAKLGRSTWTFLHTTAAYYPLSAPPQTQQNMLSLLSSLSLLYPCSWCATDFQKDMRKNQPDVSGREGLMRWLCERHNEVNRKLGKNNFDCSVKNLDVRWKDGPEDGRCD